MRRRTTDLLDLEVQLGGLGLGSDGEGTEGKESGRGGEHLKWKKEGRERRRERGFGDRRKDTHAFDASFLARSRPSPQTPPALRPS